MRNHPRRDKGEAANGELFEKPRRCGGAEARCLARHLAEWQGDLAAREPIPQAVRLRRSSATTGSRAARVSRDASSVRPALGSICLWDRYFDGLRRHNATKRLLHGRVVTPRRSEQAHISGSGVVKQPAVVVPHNALRRGNDMIRNPQHLRRLLLRQVSDSLARVIRSDIGGVPGQTGLEALHR